MKQVALNRLNLPLPKHDSCRGLALDFEGEDGVVAGLRVQNLRDSPRIDGHGDRRASSPVHHSGDETRTAQAASCTFAEVLPRIGFNRQYLGHVPSLLKISRSRNASATLSLHQMKSLLTEVSR